MKRGTKFWLVALATAFALCASPAHLHANGEKKEPQKGKSKISKADQAEIDKAWRQLQRTSPEARNLEEGLFLDAKLLNQAEIERMKLELLKANAVKIEGRFLRAGDVRAWKGQSAPSKVGDWNLVWPPRGQPAMPRLDRPMDPAG